MKNAKADGDDIREIESALTARDRKKRADGRYHAGCACRKAISFCKKNVRTALVFMMCITASGAAVTAMTNVSYAVSINGEEMGSVKSKSEVTAAVSHVEEQLTEIFGYEYSLAEQVSVTPDLAGTAGNDIGEDIEDVIMESVQGVVSAYHVKVDGETVCSVADSSVLDSVLAEILTAYTVEGAKTVRFIEEVSLECGYAAEDTLYDAAALKTLLDPAQGGLTVECTVAEYRTEEIPYTTSYCTDDTIYEGDEAVVTPGQMGEETIAVYSIYHNGILQNTFEGEPQQTQAPVAEVIAQGTLERPVTASTGTYIWPTDAVITSYFGVRDIPVGSSNHAGIDLAGDANQPIYAADGGVVIFAGEYGGYGNLVQIQHDNGEITYYGHCNTLIVKEGDAVYQGQLIALMGSTGVSTGDHCHFEIRTDADTPVDPLLYFPEFTGETVETGLSEEKLQAAQETLAAWEAENDQTLESDSGLTE
jgi:murein DD-endopeptidase MepM/ murein hydrolase activator NlpD